MGETTIRQALVEVVDKMIDNDPSILAVFHEMRKQLKGFPYKYVDVLGQKFHSPLDNYDLWAFGQSNACVKDGSVAIFQIPVGSEPLADKERVGNGKVLSELEFPFYGEISYSNGAGADGWVGNKAPVNAFIARDGKAGFCIVEPQKYNIEIGHVPFEKVWMGITRAGKISDFSMEGIARWPYQQDKITVIVANGFHFVGSKKFEELKKDVYGDFFSLPNPWRGDWR